MAAEIVHDDDIAGSKRGDQDLFDIGSEGLAIDWGAEKPRRLDPAVAHCPQERSSLPGTMRALADQTLAARPPASQRGHVGLGPGFVDEDQTLRFDAILILSPLRPPPCDVRTVALASHYGFFKAQLLGVDELPTRRV